MNATLSKRQKGLLRKYYAAIGFKPCWLCMSVKSISEFSMDKSKPDGRQGLCKACDMDVKQEYRGSPENKKRAAKIHNDWCLNNRSRINRNKREWRKRNRDRTLAQNRLNYAVRMGRVTRPSSCSTCGVSCFPDGHHSDYANHLDVDWLCQGCHRELHKQLRRKVSHAK